MTRQPLVLLGPICLILFLTPPAGAQSVDWIRQFGTTGWETTTGVASDALGNVFAANHTDGPRRHSLRKFDANGALSWTRQIGPAEYDSAVIVAADGLGNSYLAGITEGSVAGPSAGGTDFFVRKYDSAGGVLWTNQDGTNSLDYARSAAVDNLGNLYLTGFTGGNLAGAPLGSYDAFLIKYDALGNEIWKRQFGTSTEDYAEGVAADGLGNIYVAGYTAGALGGPFAGGYDMFLAKYDDAGNQLWKRQLGTASADYARDVAVDHLGNVYLVGSTDGMMQIGAPGGGDIALTRFDPSGNVIWTRQFGTPSYEGGRGASVDGHGNVFLGGLTSGNFGGPRAGDYDGFVLKYLNNGTMDWIYQIGTPAQEIGHDLSYDGSGNVYFIGSTQGVLGSSPAGGQDSFLVKIIDQSFVPEPTSLAHTCLLVLVGLWLPRQGSRLHRRDR